MFARTTMGRSVALARVALTASLLVTFSGRAARAADDEEDLTNPYVVPEPEVAPEPPPAPSPPADPDPEAEPEVAEESTSPVPVEDDSFDDDADFGGTADEPTEFLGPGEVPSDLGSAPVEAPSTPDLVNFRISGFVAADGRVFFKEPIHPGQLRGDAVSLVVEPELSMTIDGDTHLFVGRPFYRLDPIDANRSHFDVRKALYRVASGSWEAGLGVGQFSWGALDFYRPTDVLNQTDFVERIDGTAKLGQPFVNLGYVGEAVALQVYYLPYFRERTFQGIQGRLRAPVVVAGDAELESDLGPWQPSGAFRFTVVAGDFDFGLGGFTGLSREPRFIAELSSGTVFPRYDRMHQGSADVQWTLGPVSVKGEGFVRLWSEELYTFGGAGGGIDYSLFDLFGAGIDLTFIAEYLYDSRGLDAPPTFFENDAFGGIRLSLDEAGTTVIGGGVLVDVLDGTLFGRTSARRRFGDHWVVSVDGEFFMAPPDKLESSLSADSHVEARLAHYF